jgi:hypothetical protein
VHRTLLSVTHDGRLRRDESGETVQLVARTELLPDPDAGVGDEDPEKERVAPVAEEQRQDPEREQDRVERRDRVGWTIVAGMAGGRLLGVPRAAQRCRFRLAQAFAHRPIR